MRVCCAGPHQRRQRFAVRNKTDSSGGINNRKSKEIHDVVTLQGGAFRRYHSLRKPVKALPSQIAVLMPLLRSRAAHLSCAAFACLVSIAVSCESGGGGATTTPTSSVASSSRPIDGPQPSATPTPPPADPTLAADLRYRGDFEGAAAVYAAVAAESEGPERQQALLGQAQMLLRAEQPGAARATLDTHVLESGPATEGSTGQY